MLGSTIRLHRADTLELADFLLLATDATVLLTDTTFLDGRWQDALAMADRVHQLVTTVICADPVDRPFLSKLHERGALEVLWMPLELHRLRSTIGRAHEVTVERRLWASSAHQAA